MSTLTINTLTASMGAEISNIDLDDGTVPELLFHDLGFSPDTQLQFSERLGTLDRTNGCAGDYP